MALTYFVKGISYGAGTGTVSLVLWWLRVRHGG